MRETSFTAFVAWFIGGALAFAVPSGCKLLDKKTLACAVNADCVVTGHVCCSASMSCLAQMECDAVVADAGADAGVDAGPALDTDAASYTACDLPQTVSASQAFSQKVISDVLGNTTLVWNEDVSGTEDAIFAIRLSADAGWGDGGMIVGEIDASIQSSPAAAVDESGRVAVAWSVTRSGSQDRVRLIRYTPGPGWGGPSDLDDSDGGGRFGSARVALNRVGEGAVVWVLTPNSQGGAVRARRLLSDGGQSDVAVIGSPGDAGNVSDPDVGVDDGANIIAIWRESQSAIYRVWAARFTQGGAWGSPILLETQAESSISRLVVDRSGQAIAAWRRNIDAGSATTAWASRFTPDGGWGTAVQIDGDYPNRTYSTLEMAVDPGGNALAAWMFTADGGGSPNGVAVNRFAADGGWESAAAIAVENEGVSGVAVAFEPNGRAVVAWSAADGGATLLKLRRHVPGVGWLQPTIAAVTAGSSMPSLSADSRGQAIAAWAEAVDGGLFMERMVVCR